MKKNAMLKIAAILMVAVLLTTCAISSTFAKYVSTDTITDSARVAKWGIVVDITGDAIFDTKYNNGSATVVSATEKVIAPGVSNKEAISISITGKAEVATKVDVAGNATSGEFVTLTGWNDVYACPLKFYVNGTLVTVAAGAKADAVAAAVNAEIRKTLKNIAVNPVDTEVKQVLTVGYSWDYEDTSLSPAEQKALDDIDTYYGKLANAGTAPRLLFDFTATVSQYGGNDLAFGEYVAQGN